MQRIKLILRCPNFLPPPALYLELLMKHKSSRHTTFQIAISNLLYVKMGCGGNGCVGILFGKGVHEMKCMM